MPDRLKHDRVLHVIDHLTAASGVASVVMLCITGIKHVPQDVAVYGKCDETLKKTVESCGGRVHKLPDITGSFGLKYQMAFSKLLQNNPYHIIHGHLLNAAFIYLRLAKKHHIPHRMIHAHSIGVSSPIKRFRNNILSSKIPLWANYYIAVSEKAARFSFEKLHINLDDVNIIYNGIDTGRFKYVL